MNARRGCAVVMLVAGSAAPVVLAQAPTTAQVWEVQFVVDSTGAFAAGPSATQVGITIVARVNILPNSSAPGTTNFGISRVGGAGSATSGFRVVFTDQVSADLGRNQGSVAPGETGETRNLDPVSGAPSPTGVTTLLRDTNGEPLRGTYGPYRGSFLPQVGPLFLGSNSDSGNGRFFNPDTGSPLLANLVGSRSFNFGSDGSGPQGADGEFAPCYRMFFFPSAGGERTIDLFQSAMNARYIYSVNGTQPPGNNVPIPSSHVLFQVPSPGAASVLVVGVAAVARRRRC